MKQLNRLGNYLNRDYGGNYAGNVYDRKFACQNILTMTGGSRQPMVVRIYEKNKSAYLCDAEKRERPDI